MDEPDQSEIRVENVTAGDTNCAILGHPVMRAGHQYKVSVTACTVEGCHTQPAERGQTVNGVFIPRRESGKEGRRTIFCLN